jgi:cytoskeleton protein RodZ
MSAAGEGSPGGPGSRLHAERERQGLTLAKAAEQLRLDGTTVEAIEAGRFADLGAAVYARGYLRKYAALLGLPGEELVAEYDRQLPANSEPSLIPAASAREYSASRRPLLLGAAALAMLVIVGGSLWWFTRQGGDGTPVTAPAPESVPASATPAAAAPEPVSAGAAEPMAAAQEGPVRDDGTPAAAVAESPAQIAARAAATTVPAAPAPSGAGGLEITFASPCWIEVYDLTGRRLAFDLAPARSTRRLPGAGPWRIVLGNAAAATITANGRDIAIPEALVLRNTAWVEVSRDGAVTRPPGARLVPGGP